MCCDIIIILYIFHIAMSEEKGKAKERETAKERAKKKRMVKKLPHLSPRPSSHSDPHRLLRQSIRHVEN